MKLNRLHSGNQRTNQPHTEQIGMQMILASKLVKLNETEFRSICMLVLHTYICIHIHTLMPICFIEEHTFNIKYVHKYVYIYLY